jgi:hypothetical protein
MKQFNKADEAINYAGRFLLKNGCRLPSAEWQGKPLSEKETMRVALNYNFICKTPDNLTTLCQTVEPDKPWAEDHFQERVGGRPVNPGETYKKWPYNNFDTNPFMRSNKFDHTYMERYWPIQAGEDEFMMKGIRYSYGDLDDVVNQLRNDPTTRQAYLPVWFPEDTGAKHGGRVPCTLGYLFIPVGDYLHINYYIRSCDLYRHFRNDVYLTMRLLQWVVDKLEMWEPGLLTMHIANFHYFDNDLYHIKKDKRWKLKD